MSSDPNYRVAEAMRKVALRLEEAFQTGKVDSIDANQLSEILLLIAEELDPPLPTKHESHARG
jgi:hypothetical protein